MHLVYHVGQEPMGFIYPLPLASVHTDKKLDPKQRSWALTWAFPLSPYTLLYNSACSMTISGCHALHNYLM